MICVILPVSGILRLGFDLHKRSLGQQDSVNKKNDTYSKMHLLLQYNIVRNEI
jgi:hypothetical protein